MKKSDIKKRMLKCGVNIHAIEMGLAMAALHIVEGDLTKADVLALLDIEIAYYQKDEPK